MPHIVVCICTYKRPQWLSDLLTNLVYQMTDGLFTYSIVVVDNDVEFSGRVVVKEMAKVSAVKILYQSEPEQGIPYARNTAVATADGEYVAFLDDDQLVESDWLAGLFRCLISTGADGVIGPVPPHYEVLPPAWVKRGEFFDRPVHRHGQELKWQQTRTGNVLLNKTIFEGADPPFNTELLTGEDRDFFRRKIVDGCRIVWCSDSPAHERIPLERMTRSFMLRRALFRGRISIHYASMGRLHILKSLLAITLYTSILPFMLLGGQHLFMKYLIKNCDHLGRVLAFAGIVPAKDRYVS